MGGTPQQNTRPENAEAQARELLSISQPKEALELLTNVLGNRRHKTWSQLHENLMKLHLDICVDLRLSRELKDGLHQYRNLCQQQAPNSLEAVIMHLLDLVEKLPCDASADPNAYTKSDSYDHPALRLTQTLVPPTDELAKNIRFVSEAHRSILDILKSHSKLSHVYHNTADLALSFLAENGRHSDVKRLCEYLRSHLINVQRYGAKAAGSNDSKSMRNWDGWTNESLGEAVQTKLTVLKLCQKLKIPSEIYRTLEDIHSLRKLGHKLQLTTLASGSKFVKEYHFILASVCLVNKDYFIVGLLLAKLLDAELAESDAQRNHEYISQLANTLTLCTICSPLKPTSRQIKLIHLIHDLVKIDLVDEISQKYIQHCEDSVRELYNVVYSNGGNGILQSDFSSLLQNIESTNVIDFKHAEQPNFQTQLKITLATKHMKILSKFYSVVKISSLFSKFGGVISPEDLEKIMIEVGRVDWRNDSLRFEPPSNKDWIVDLAKSLSKVQLESKPNLKTSFFDEIKASLVEENKAAVARKNIIEREKEEAERKQMEEAMEEAAKKEAEDAKRKEEEKRRLAIEEKKRELVSVDFDYIESIFCILLNFLKYLKEKQKKIQDELQEIEKKKYLAALGQNPAEVNQDLSVEELARRHQEKLAKKKEKQEKSLSLRLKKLDYTVRAIRDEEMSLIKDQHEASLVAHREYYEKDVVEKAAADKKEWEVSIERKNALSSFNIFSYTADLESIITSREDANYSAIKEKCDEDARQAAQAQKLKRAKKRRADEIRKKEEEERIAKEEAMRLEKEREDAKRKAEEEERIRASESKQASEERGSTSGRYVPPSRRGGGSKLADRESDSGRDRFGNSRFGRGEDRERGMGGYRRGGSSSGFGRSDDRGMGSFRRGDDRGAESFRRGDDRGAANSSGSGGRYIPPSRREASSRDNAPRENSRWGR